MFICWLFAIYVSTCASERILALVTYPSRSHQIYYQPLWEELARRGHDVVVVTTDPTNNYLPNFREISLASTYQRYKKYNSDMLSGSIFSVLLSGQFQNYMMEITKFQMELPQLQELINNQTEHFDLVIGESLMYYVFAFKYRFNCPLIQIYSMDALPQVHYMLGNTNNYLLYPSGMCPYHDGSTLIRRLKMFFTNLLFTHYVSDISRQYTQVLQPYFGDAMPPIIEIMDETDMLFANENRIYGNTRPYTPSTITLAGGMHIRAEKPLQIEVKQFLDGATNGAIYFSLGTLVGSSHMKEKLIELFVATFKQIPYRVLFTFNGDNLIDMPENVKALKWAAQQDVLSTGHKNMKLFISQGGLLSLEEALIFNVPVIVIPFVWDQFMNAQKAESNGLGIQIDKATVTVEEFKAAILEMMQNTTYAETAQRLGRQHRDIQVPPLELAVWWTEYVLRHKGAQHLKGKTIPLYQYYYLDILGVITTILILVVWLLYLMMRCIIRLVGVSKRMISKVITSKKDKMK